jgi:hypothetical protein
MSSEEILPDLYDSEINVAISWLWDGGIDVGLASPRVLFGKPWVIRAPAVEFRGDVSRSVPLP